MKKKDLKGLMVVEIRSDCIEKKRVMFKNVLWDKRGIVVNGGMKYYNDNLQNLTERRLDIIKVYEIKKEFQGNFEDLFKDENLELKWERKKKIKLARLQYEILKRLYDEGWKYLARDKSGEVLWAYDYKPVKKIATWEKGKGEATYISKCLEDLDFIKWEDEESTDLLEILDNCEVIN